jgi:coenzyme F420-0:L-glutamate ligase/coenzyme F420-1:gamma-L-glutamate ligase
MPNLFDGLKQRRSIRKYQDKSVSKEAVEKILAAASWAPSAHNAQPWLFIVLEDAPAKRRLAQAMAETWTADMTKDGLKIDDETRRSRIDRFGSAPVLIVASMFMEGMAKQPDAERQSIERDLAMASLGAAMQNLLLAASAEGLGACWFCAPAFCKDTVRKVLGIPADVEPQALVTLGYPAEHPLVPPRKAVREIAFKNEWGKF